MQVDRALYGQPAVGSTRFRKLLAIGITTLAGLGGGWLWWQSGGTLSRAIAESPTPESRAESGTDGTETESLFQALPMVTSAPALPVRSGGEPARFHRSREATPAADPFARPAVAQQSAPAADPFAAATDPAESVSFPQRTSQLPAPGTPTGEVPSSAFPAAARPHHDSLPLNRWSAGDHADSAADPFLRERRAEPQINQSESAPSFPQVRPASNEAPARDIFAPAVDETPAATPAAEPQGAFDPFAPQSPQPAPAFSTTSPPTAQSEFPVLAPPIEDRFQSGSPAAPPALSPATNDSFGSSNPPAAANSGESFFPSFPESPSPASAAAPAFPPARQEEAYFNNRPAPLERGHAPQLSSPPAGQIQQQRHQSGQVSEERIYEVRPGDSYWTISKACYGSGRYFGALAQYNAHRIPTPEKMKPGMKVLIPDALLLHQQYPQLVGPAEPKASLPAGFFVDPQGRPAYRVGEGDTLTGIAQQYLGRVSRAGQLYELNRDRIRDPNNLALGTVLTLPPDASQIQPVYEAGRY
jgi:nucleoid-associated protein YgaU